MARLRLSSKQLFLVRSVMHTSEQSDDDIETTVDRLGRQAAWILKDIARLSGCTIEEAAQSVIDQMTEAPGA